MIDLFSDLIGKKYRKGGRGPDFFDCYGLIIECAKRAGFELPEQETPEGCKLRLKMFEEIASEFAEPIQKPELFCIVVFQGVGTGGLHIGMLYPDSQQFIHEGGLNPLKRSVRIDRIDQWPWKHGGFFRLTRKCQKYL